MASLCFVVTFLWHHYLFHVQGRTGISIALNLLLVCRSVFAFAPAACAAATLVAAIVVWNVLSRPVVRGIGAGRIESNRIESIRLFYFFSLYSGLACFADEDLVVVVVSRIGKQEGKSRRT